MARDLRRLRLGEILIEEKVITAKELGDALEATKRTGDKLGEVLINLGFITEKQLLETLGNQLGLEVVDLNDHPIDLDQVKLISEDWAKKYNVLVLGQEDDRLRVAMSNPLDYNTRDSLSLFSKKKPEIVLVAHRDLSRAIQRSYRELNVASAIGDMDQSQDLGQEDLGQAADQGGLAGQPQIDESAPIVALLNNILSQAVNAGASDIHFEPFEAMSRVRMRIDGDLKEAFSLKNTTYNNLVARIKVVSNLNTVERRLPQDGRINMVVNRQKIDFRISILPAYIGEKVVIRVLNQSQEIPQLEDLGFPDKQAAQFRRLIKNPNGILLVTGPTGSGKTTTLYAVLSSLNDISKNITTVENPVEYKLFGINQIQTNEALGLNFSVILRSILRQDPDIIMVGEIRDEETAQIASRAASTGHLVLSTLHTNDSVSAVTRLLDIGVAPYLIIDALRGVVAQRLVKIICPQCKESYPASPEEAGRLNIQPHTSLYRGRGCSHCDQTGYRGRTAVYEVLTIDESMKEAIEKMTSSKDLYRAAADSTIFLEEAARQRVLDGTTSFEEYAKIVFDKQKELADPQGPLL